MKALQEWWLRRNAQHQYGVLWDRDTQPRCLNCRRMLIYTREPHIMLCARCHSKHVLRTDDGSFISVARARVLIKESKV